jgi:hypothetical protein
MSDVSRVVDGEVGCARSPPPCRSRNCSSWCWYRRPVWPWGYRVGGALSGRGTGRHAATCATRCCMARRENPGEGGSPGVVTDDTASGQHVGHRVAPGFGGTPDQSASLGHRAGYPEASNRWRRDGHRDRRGPTTPHKAGQWWPGRRKFCIAPTTRGAGRGSWRPLRLEFHPLRYPPSHSQPRTEGEPCPNQPQSTAEQRIPYGGLSC